MFNKLVTGSLTAALVFGGALTTADASSSSDHSTNLLYQNHVSFATNGSDWTNPFANQLTLLHSGFPQIQWSGDQEDDDASSQQDETDQHSSQEQDKPADHNEADQSDNHSGQNTDDQHQGNAGKPDTDCHHSNQSGQPNTGAQHQNPSNQPNTDDQRHHQSGQQGTDDQQHNQSGQSDIDGQQQDSPDHQGDGQQQDSPEQQPNDQQSGQPGEQPQQSGNSGEQQPEQDQGSQQVSAYEQQVVELTNEERTSRGLEPLKMDTALSNVARKKSSDMASNNYFSHDSPNYGSPFDMMKQFDISYQTAGENIARGQKAPEEVVNGWMNSEGHRENILNSDFTHIGVGYVENGHYWTQQFIGK